jgi:2-oxoglutarate dehydrogenase E2 component (dihydrolipoamide succinyltransferase)
MRLWKYQTKNQANKLQSRLVFMVTEINNQINILAMPSAAKIIKEKHIDISEIKGTGKDGRVTKGDVLLHLNLIKENISTNDSKSNIDKNILKKGDGIMDVLVPILGESVVEATVSKWIKKQGDFVEIDDPIVELETDKVTLEVPAAVSGIIDHVAVSEGDTVEVGALLAMIVAGEKTLSNTKPIIDKIEPVKTEKKLTKEQPKKEENGDNSIISPNRSNVNLEERVPMSRLRQAIARRLKEAQNTAAMLTTYNEVDMTALMEMRSNYQDSFEKKNGVRLGYMSFFVKASIDALREFPAVNAEIEGNDIIYKNYYNIGVAVGTSQGLVVPVLRNADRLSFGETEMNIVSFGKKAKDGDLAISDMAGGTFTISNGGVYGSLMSSPILNPPQSGILGMHKIQKRPVAIGNNIEIRPMMYLALSYDHRIIDGREAVSFLVRIKEIIEDPRRLVIGA